MNPRVETYGAVLLTTVMLAAHTVWSMTESVLGERKQAGDFVTRELALPELLVVRWSDDGRSVLAVYKDEALNRSVDRRYPTWTVRRFSYPDWRPKERIDIAGHVKSLERSKLGWVVGIHRHRDKPGEVWLLDDESLQPTSKIDVPQLAAAKTSPASHLVFVAGSDSNVGEIHTVDLRQKKVLRSVATRKIPNASSVRRPRGTPFNGTIEQMFVPAHGRFVIASAGGSIVRIHLSGSVLRYQELSARVSSNVGNLVLSHDGEYVAKSGHDILGKDGSGALVFRTSSLRQPVHAIKAHLYAFDPENKRLAYGLARGANGFAAYDMATGQAVRHYPFHGVPMFDPTGTRFIIKHHPKLLWVTDTTRRVLADGERPAKPVEKLEGGAQLSGELRDLGQATAQTLNGLSQTLPTLQWSRYADAFYTLSRTGLLRRIGLPDLRETHRLDVETSCDQLLLSSEGLVLVSRESQTLFIVDEQTFELKRRFLVAGLRWAASSRLQPMALASLRTSVSAQSEQHKLIDLKFGRPIDPQARTSLKQRDKSRVRDMGLVGMVGGEVTPDGRTFILRSTSRAYRFRRRGNDLIYEEPLTGEPLPVHTLIGPDGVYVAGKVAAELRDVTDRKRGAYIYRIPIHVFTRLARPTRVIETDMEPIATRLDRPAERVYVLQADGRVAVHNKRGEFQFDLPVGRLAKPGTRVTETPERAAVSIHPGGHRMLVLFDDQLHWVQFKTAPDRLLAAPASRRTWLEPQR